MSPITADHPRQAFPLKSVVVGEIVMVGNVEPSSSLSITPKSKEKFIALLRTFDADILKIIKNVLD